MATPWLLYQSESVYGKEQEMTEFVSSVKMEKIY